MGTPAKNGRSVQFGTRRCGFSELIDVAINLGIGHPDPGLDLALTNPLDQQLIANVAAKARVGQALSGQALAPLASVSLMTASISANVAPLFLSSA